MPIILDEQPLVVNDESDHISGDDHSDSNGNITFPMCMIPDETENNPVSDQLGSSNNPEDISTHSRCCLGCAAQVRSQLQSSRKKNDASGGISDDDGYLVLAIVTIFVNPPIGLLAFFLASMLRNILSNFIHYIRPHTFQNSNYSNVRTTNFL